MSVDERVGSQASSLRRGAAGAGGAPGAGAGSARMRHVCARAPDVSSPACLRVVCAPGAPPAPPGALRDAPHPPGHCELAGDAVALDDSALAAHRPRSVPAPRRVRAVRGREELPCLADARRPQAPLAAPEDDRLEGDEARGGAASAGARAYVTLPRRRAGVAAALFRGARLPPARTTPDGTDIYYWCDLPKHARRLHGMFVELDGLITLWGFP